ncbi:MAG: ATP-grasp domain-containing protein [Mesorhizobium sp.]|uniref:ATP-grasp domain-containing protein n=1 Tax=Mesorhizobium sp. TaxID=1871066 RepID=UPI000FE9C961|nr:acetyl-CoA carboxylase biotin carboxylase subunit family protein [Mesorhizobium sp.]RWG50444.1 MAG: ATP-grasp domain-containing protein [Mesorhizobium sp.]RWL05201.1 MAG: ATP-grasp domain-containing protein [Mesorhizobium sp.]TIN10224.1 MAG: ATP-grasp domain-containing protein [Mesorhizobium sp.]TIQ62178.1 MAG: ATP-grasp domain-containing protein [Mesorhizobium sp.]
MARNALILVEGNTTGTGLLYVEAAQRLGLHPITLSTDTAQYDHLATENLDAIRVDTDDIDALIRECSRLREIYHIAGITCAREAFYATVAKLCQHFDLPGPDPLSIERCCNKFAQRQALAEAGIPVPAFRLAANATNAERAAAEIGLPVIVKPAVGVGSSGVRLCRNIEEVTEHAAYLLGGGHVWRSEPRILVEEFANGPYYCADLMGHEIVALSAGEFGPQPHFVFSELTCPAMLSAPEFERIAEISRSSLRTLGLDWGPSCIELRLTKIGPIVIEVNPRLAGSPNPQLIQLAYGVDLITEHIKLAIGDEWNVRKTHSLAAGARILLPDRDGVLDRIDGVDQAVDVSGVAEVKFYNRPPTPIVRRGDHRDWMGYVIAVSPTSAETEAALQRAVELIDWSISPIPSVGEIEH